MVSNYLDSQSFGLLETCLLTMESRLTNTDGCLEYQIELEESMAYMHQCSLFGDSRSILLKVDLSLQIRNPSLESN